MRNRYTSGCGHCFVLPLSLAAGPHARCQPRVVRSPAVHAPGVRSARSCHMPAARPGSLPHGQLSAPRGLRIRAYGSPLTRSASGRVLSPRYAAIWPMAALSGRASVMRHARAAAHTLRVIVRPATLSGLSAHVWASGQGWWQRRTADTKKLRPLVFWYSDSMRMEAPLCSEALRNGSMACRVIRTFIDVCAIASCPYRNRYY